MPCCSFVCESCRKTLKSVLFENTVKASFVFGLDKHLVLTTEGSDYRDYYSYEQSYIDMAESWKRLKQVLQYNKKIGKFDYVMFPRAQKNGYCHYHILLSKYVKKTILNEKIKKYNNIGFFKIKRNVSVAEYLTKDFFKDSEYIIPFAKRHFNCSKNVRPYMNISGMFTKNPDNIIFNLVNNNIPVIDQYYKIVNDAVGLPVPIENLVFAFVKNNPEKNKIITKTILTQSVFAD